MPAGDIQDIIRNRIAAAPDRMLSFAAVMELALYHPGHGYYGRGPVRIGRRGDFYTAVSVGPLYGRLLAELAARIWHRLGAPDEFTIIEQGAHDGQLMEDVARGLESIGSPLAEKACFLIVEPNENYRAAQAAKLAPLLGSRIGWRCAVEGLLKEPGQAFFITNELLDAFPVHRIRWDGRAWGEQMVTLGNDGASLVWRDAPIADPRVDAEASRLPVDLPPGYTTEVHPAAAEWMRQVGGLAFQGAVLVADYGFESGEYYSPERMDGTVRRYHDHKMDGDVLQDPGACDLTSHVNFSRLLEEAAPKFEMRLCLDQGRFLTHLAAPWLRSLEGTPASPATASLLRQFHTLTHPSHMGGRFRMCLLGRGIGSAPLPGAA